MKLHKKIFASVTATALLVLAINLDTRAVYDIVQQAITSTDTTGHWTLDTADISGNTINDISTANHDGTATNFSGGGAANTGWVTTGTGANDTGVGTTAWSSPTSVQADDTSYATAAGGGGAGWYDATYAYRKKLTIDETKVGGAADLTNYPILVSIASDANLETVANGGHVQDGNDIIFVNSANTTKLDHEIESYTATTGALNAWVEIPTLSVSADTDIYVYYGKTAAGDQQNVAGVWGAYEAVLHLNDVFTDSAKSHDGTNNNTTASAGVVANGRLCDESPTTRFFYLPEDGTTLDISTNMTTSIWVRPTEAFVNWDRIMVKGDSAGAYEGWFLAVATNLSNVPSVNFYNTANGNGYARSTVSLASNGSQWYHLAGVKTNTDVSLFTNGSETESASGAFSGTPRDVGGNVYVCASYLGWGQRFKGDVDEVRIAKTNLSAGWIATEYNTITLKGTGAGKFIKTVASEEPASGTATTNYLKASNFGFSVPADATITGVEVQYDRKNTSGATTTTSTVKLVNASGTVVGNNGSGGATWTTTDALETLGGASSMWGLSLTPTDVNDADFGVVLSASHTGNASQYASVDYMQMKVYYTTPTTGFSLEVAPVGQGVNFDGTNDYVNVATSVGTVKSLSFWMQADDTTSRGILNMNGTAGVELDSSSNVIATGFTDPTVYVNGEINAGGGGGSWFDSGYGYRKKLTIDNTLVSGSSDLTDFPVLVSLTDTALKTTGGHVTDAQGDDIIFVNSADDTKLDHEVESYDAATGAINMWVRFPTLSGSTDTDFYIYYGNSNVTSSQEDKAGVWNSNFKGVWHLKEDPTLKTSPNGCNGASAEVCDSTANNNIANSEGTMSSADQVPGKIGGSIDFDNSDDLLNFPETSTLAPSGDMSLSLWAKFTQVASTRGTNEVLVFKGSTVSPNYQYQFYQSTDNKLYLQWVNSSATVYTTEGSSALSASQWYHIAYVKSGSAGKIYINGVDNTSYSPSHTGTILGSSNGFFLDTWIGSRFNGLLDEARVSDTARSADWIKTEYDNQNNQGTGTDKFIKTVATEETPPSSGGIVLNNLWNHIVITDNTGVSATAFKIGVFGSNYFDGMIDDVRIYSTPIDQNKVNELNATQPNLTNTFQSRLTSFLTNNLVGWWSFDGADMTGTASPGTPTDTGWDPPAAGANATGVGTVAWSSPGNALSDNTTYATAAGTVTAGWFDSGYGYRKKLTIDKTLVQTATDPVWFARTGWDETVDVGSESMPAFVDIDNDGDMDLYMAGSAGTSVLYDNTGSKYAPTWTDHTGTGWDIPDVGSYSAVSFADLDGDGDKDAMVGENAGVVKGYKNTGSATVPAWAAETGWNTTDLGDEVSPTLGDLDGDGDYDMLVGNRLAAGIAIENTGNASAPTWTDRVSTAWDILPSPGEATPCLVDMDNDGDLDAMVGNSSGTVQGYKNTGSASAPTWAAQASWDMPDVGSAAAPALADLDNNGSVDAVVGELNGFGKGYENTASTTLPDFPVLISIATDANLETTGNGGHVTDTQGDDIIFVDGTNTTELDYEREFYDPATGQIIMWVRFPNLNNRVDTDFYVYYGNSGVTTSQENITGVWSNNYKGVWHLDEDPTTNTCSATEDNCDSTVNSHDGVGTNLENTDDVAAKIGIGLDVDGVDEYSNLANPAGLQLTNNMTLSAWVYPDANPADDGDIISKWATGQQGWVLKSSPDTGTHKFTVVVNSNATTAAQRHSSTTRSLNTWYHVTGVYNAAGQDLDIYVNGVQDNGTLVGTIPTSQYNSTQNVNIGRRPGGGYLFNGKIDELRVSNAARTKEWVKTDFNNQNNQGTGAGKFIKTLASEEAAGGTVTTNYLRASQFGFTIPTDATITGIQVQFDRKTAGTSTTTSTVKLVDASGNVFGNNNSGGASWTASDAVETIGTSTEMWGLNTSTLTPTVVNNTNFGFVVSASHTGTAAQNASVDYMQMIVYYTPVGSSNLVAVDRSVGAHDGALTTYSQGIGPLGQALEFDGTSDFVDINNVGSGIKTIAFWIKADVTASKKIMNIDGTDQIELNASSQVVATSFPAATRYVDGAAGYAIPDTGWHHVVITDTTGVNASNLELGRVGTSYFDGMLDDVRIYNSVLTPAEIASLYAHGTASINSSQNAQLTGGLVGLWSFDGANVDWSASTTEIKDANPGTLHHGDTSASLTSGSTMPGPIGQALEFNGSNDYVNVGNSGLTVKTVAFWMKADDTTTRDIIKLNATPTNINLNGSSVVTATAFTTPTIYVDGAVASTIPDTGWHHVAVTTNTGIAASTFEIGRSTTYFDGILDDVRVYNVALPAANIVDLYNMGAY